MQYVLQGSSLPPPHVIIAHTVPWSVQMSAMCAAPPTARARVADVTPSGRLSLSLNGGTPVDSALLAAASVYLLARTDWESA